MNGKEIKRYRVIEDNGGRLTLVTFALDGTVDYACTGYEYSHGDLCIDLELLDEGHDPFHDWDGCMDGPQEFYDNLTYCPVAYEVIADNDGIYYDKMGGAGFYEFGCCSDTDYIELNIEDELKPSELFDILFD